MFPRVKRSGKYSYVQLVENRRENGRTRQRVVCTLGRLEKLIDDGVLENLAEFAGRFSNQFLILSAHRNGELNSVQTRKIGPGIVFERLWKETGCQEVVQELLANRKFKFSIERAIFLTVLHRLFKRKKTSDRGADTWKKDYKVEGGEEIKLHQLYRAMAWLGEILSVAAKHLGRTPFYPRCTKDLVEERLFNRRRNLFTSLDLVFFDTTSLYFEGEGGNELGKFGKSKDHRSDRRQMVVGVVLDGKGTPVCCEIWPGNTSDMKTMIPVAKRLKKRFGIERICVVADRAMFTAEIIEDLERRNWLYILGAKMRTVNEVKKAVLSRAGRYSEVREARKSSKDLAPLKVKEVKIRENKETDEVVERRYVVCYNEDQAKKDAADREKIVDDLVEKLKKGEKPLVGNKGYRKCINSDNGAFQINWAKVEKEARYDGKFVLRTNTDLPTAEVALKYKQLISVEDIFRTMKSVLDTRPVHHKRDETIRGHVFCSFLALVMRKELMDRIEKMGTKLEWENIVSDLESLTETLVEKDSKLFALRSDLEGVAGKVLQAVGVAAPRSFRQVTSVS